MRKLFSTFFLIAFCVLGLLPLGIAHSQAGKVEGTCSRIDVNAEAEMWTRPVPDGLKRYAYPVWYKRFGVTGYDNGYALAVTSDCGVLMFGTSNSNETGTNDAWLIKMDRDGNVQWERTYGGPQSEFVIDGLALPDGGFFIVGHTSLGPARTQDVWLARGDANGDLLWQKTMGGPQSDRAKQAVMTSDGDFLVAGATASKGAGSSDA